MKKIFYSQIYNLSNLILAWRKARKGKTKRKYVIKFENDLIKNLLQLHEELKTQTYSPLPLETFILRDPKTRKISRADFRDRIVHHALCNIISKIFERIFIYDSCANRVGKGNLFAIKRFEKFRRKITNNWTSKRFCLKADIKHYFEEVNHKILIDLVSRKIEDEKIIWLIEKILEMGGEGKKGMPLGNLTSQFFANVYLNNLDYFVKHILKVKYYIRYVDDFIILHKSKEQLKIWKKEIEKFLNTNLGLQLHPDKSKIISLSRGIDFVGFRNFYYFKLLRRRNIRKILSVLEKNKDGAISNKKFLEIFQGWQAFAKWANSFKLRKEIAIKFLII